MSSETVMKQFGPAEGSEIVPQLFLLLDAISVGYRPIVTEEKSVRARSCRWLIQEDYGGYEGP